MNWHSFRLTADSSLPYYMQLASEIRTLILAGKLEPGEQIPVSRGFMKMLKLSSSTVEKGIGILVKEGFLIRRPRIGTFVSETPPILRPKLRKRSGKVKVIFSDITPYGEFWFKILFTLEEELKNERCELSFSRCTGKQPLDITELVQDCIGVVMCGTNSLITAREIQARKVPLVLIGGLDHEVLHEYGLDMLAHDDAECSFLGVERLLNLGHRKIAVLVPDEGTQYEARQRKGIMKAIKEFGCAEDDIRILPCVGCSLESGGELARQALINYPDTTAIFAIDAPMAAGALAAVNQLGLNVPQDLSILTAGGNWLCSATNPQLSALEAYDENLLAKRALEKLFGQIRNPEYRKSVTLLPWQGKVISRNSLHMVREGRQKKKLG